ncbi:aldo/keto reductase [Aureimonas altamirensis]|uniref:aldo/keto reductase n=1 Tax=Aureimonas altamirensis TaxID=370622 RepID=UPI001E34E130|nr:aldo/keto reductase [Aureimonas altamirensis]UHD43883.1 aldo/keto reductase [Aureimonas altamirensis]
MKFLDQEIASLGMGCWPVGGPMFGGEGFGYCGTLGYANADDDESVRTIHAALANGITLFDTAAVYGAGHAERLLAKALRGRHDALVVTKIGMLIDEETKTLLGEETDPAAVMPAIDRSLARLNRDHLDIVLLHLNALPVSKADPIFDAMAGAIRAGKVRAYGWSTDLVGNVQAVRDRDGFVAVEHASNVLLDAPLMRAEVESAGLYALIRSPLGMGLLSGKYDESTQMPASDIRSTGNTVTAYFRNGRPNREYVDKINRVRDLLQTGARSLVQGALGWLWAKSERNIPVPGARTVAQIEGIAGALAHGALPEAIVSQIDALIGTSDAASEYRPR